MPWLIACTMMDDEDYFDEDCDYGFDEQEEQEWDYACDDEVPGEDTEDVLPEDECDGAEDGAGASREGHAAVRPDARHVAAGVAAGAVAAATGKRVVAAGSAGASASREGCRRPGSNLSAGCLAVPFAVCLLLFFGC